MSAKNEKYPLLCAAFREVARREFANVPDETEIDDHEVREVFLKSNASENNHDELSEP